MSSGKYLNRSLSTGGALFLWWIFSMSAHLPAIHAQQQLKFPFFFKRCNINVVPTTPQNLALIPLDGKIQASWAPPSNRPCNVTYEIAALPTSKTPGSSVTVDVKILETTQPWVTIENLVNSVTYTVLVSAKSPTGKGPPAQAAASPKSTSIPSINTIFPNTMPFLSTLQGTSQAWRCIGDTNPPSCPAATSNLCNQLTCDEVAQRGLCSASFMKTTHWNDNTVTVYCSGTCAVPPNTECSPSLGVMPTADACCSIAAAQYWQDASGKLTNGLQNN